ncbi:alpha/beta hydrolase [Cellulophaga baltica]|uniref:RBBP9/YdeN family alpha/beta hydrolase n=1 Tax=Cellulophaga TaxID=104264 RepID=UPI001C06CC6B|nr:MULTISPECIES: alpha/beta hydrolase [Cellulophaga]MBU2997529.1 alpha/beta hydrolase [Cellulophaga baltica]MDO6768924.1 alpha/beta hydrolase [Cellulophaga sp. 1_MG-2023]
MTESNTHLLIIPGLGGSDENHWQSYWLKKYKNSTRVVQDDWNAPKLASWLENLNNTIQKIEEPIILVAHSLAVSLVAHWDALHGNPNIKGILLVAPADIDSPAHTPDIIRNFAPMPLSKLSSPSIVIASENDPFGSLERAEYFAQQWNSEFVNIGAKGHINSESDLKFWEEGQNILNRLL